jgi:hypothetical protein
MDGLTRTAQRGERPMTIFWGEVIDTLELQAPVVRLTRRNPMSQEWQSKGGPSERHGAANGKLQIIRSLCSL